MLYFEDFMEERRQRFRYQPTGHFKNPFLMRRRIVEQACRTVLKSSIGRPTYPTKPEALPNTGRLVDRAGMRKQVHARGLNGRTSMPGRKLMDSMDMTQKKTEEGGFAIRMRSSDYLQDAEMFDDASGDLETKQLGFFQSGGNVKSMVDSEDEEEEEEEDDDDDGDDTVHETVLSNTPSYAQRNNSPFFTLNSASGAESASGGAGGRIQRYSSLGSYSYNSDLSDSSTGRVVDARLNDAPSPIGWHGAGGGSARLPGLNTTPRDRRGRGIARRPVGMSSSVSGILAADARDSLLLDNLLPTSSSVGNTGVDGFEDSACSAHDCSTGGVGGGPHDVSTTVFDSGPFGPFGSEGKLDSATEDVLDEDEEDQKRYCVCNDVSYGDMIACDNPTCAFEWFHYSCVNLTVAPKGDWFCPNCAKSFIVSTKGVKKRIGRR